MRRYVPRTRSCVADHGWWVSVYTLEYDDHIHNGKAQSRPHMGEEEGEQPASDLGGMRREQGTDVTTAFPRYRPEPEAKAPCPIPIAQPDKSPTQKCRASPFEKVQAPGPRRESTVPITTRDREEAPRSTVASHPSPDEVSVG